MSRGELTENSTSIINSDYGFLTMWKERFWWSIQKFS